MIHAKRNLSTSLVARLTTLPEEILVPTDEDVDGNRKDLAYIMAIAEILYCIPFLHVLKYKVWLFSRTTPPKKTNTAAYM
jgi:hypothetical protein